MAALAAIFVPSPLPAQITFERTYGGPGGDAAYSVQQTPDGGYIIAGSTGSYGAGGSDVYLIKTDSNGDTLWTKTVGGEGTDAGWSVWQTTDRGYVVAGRTDSRGAGGLDVLLVETDANGETLWTRTYGDTANDYGYAVLQTLDGGYAVVGVTCSFGAGKYDVYFIRTGPQGDTLWTRTWGGTSFDEGWSVLQTADSGFVVCGYTQGDNARDFYLVRTDSRGETLWTRTYGGADYDEGYCVEQTTDGGFMVVGTTCPFGSRVRADAMVVKTDSGGNALWTKTYGGTTGEECFHSVRQTADGGYIFAGYTASYGAGGDDVYLVRTDSCGDTLWTRTFGGCYTDLGFGVSQTSDGGFVVVGVMECLHVSSDDVYLIKTDSLGNVAVAEPKTSPTRAPALSLTCEPNPSTGTTTIRLSPFALRHSPLTLRMYDSQGRMVLSRKVSTSSFPLSTSDLPSGAYFLRLDAAGQHATARIVLQR
jgi:TolB-like protein